MDLEKLGAQLDAANAESGPWAIEPDVADNVGLWIEALGDGGEPGEAAALFLRDVRETVLQLVTELKLALQVVEEAKVAYDASAGLSLLPAQTAMSRLEGSLRAYERRELDT